MGEPLLRLSGVWREYLSGDQTIAALKGLDLTIEAGEMVAIIGVSGSGKSTLMNILGCLDRPTRGSYRVAGRDTRELAPDQLAELRREHFGFIFQRYHLLSVLDAVGNVEVPAVYAGHPRAARRERALELLKRLGLGDRLDHTPPQLSGGQQQRVSVARALINGGRVILADEPTGALDRKSGEDMLALLKDLHAEGHTIIIVTHDASVAAHAERIIEISDGEILADRRDGPPPEAAVEEAFASSADGADWRAFADRSREAFRMAVLAMSAHRLRTFLTMLGIIIGIAAVVSVVALGEGARQKILSDISSIGTNTVDILPGKDYGDTRSGRVRTLVPRDAEALSQFDFADSVTPSLTSNRTLRYRNVSATATINGVGAEYFRVRGYELADGAFFTDRDVQRRAQEAVIDDNTLKQVFGEEANPIGQVLLLGDVPVRIIGVTRPLVAAFGNPDALQVWIPYTTAMNRVLGQTYLQRITVRVADDHSTKDAESQIVQLMLKRHRTKDFFIINTDTIRQTVDKTTSTMTLLVSAIAVISLVVGGIGVMNIMLVSVTERTREIGVRMAVGARQSDIMQQFLIEAVLVCLLGGVLGVGLAFVVDAVVGRLGFVKMVISAWSISAAFGCSSAIGVAFGFLPARHAARLDPVEALARE
jgi:macrolide transport system ATP-binding/permease protein